jgi:hypothetical protein
VCESRGVAWWPRVDAVAITHEREDPLGWLHIACALDCRAHDKHRPRRGPHHGCGNAAEKQATQPSLSTRTNRDQPSADLRGAANDSVCGSSHEYLRRGGDPSGV